ncbi:MAG: hypothetical protein EHM58_06880 [Ignavibacteriae bacterium]|nr:MAG: hypothetical protein EHM58_06880 [Ignavibacteriota bacterium]
MKVLIFLLTILLYYTISYASYYNISSDTVIFHSEKEGLIILTQNIDSIKYHIIKVNYPNPFSPSMRDFSAKINTYDSTALTINITDKLQKLIVTFIWNKIPPGAYRFDWWEYVDMKGLKSGVYYVETFTKEGAKSTKALIVK